MSVWGVGTSNIPQHSSECVGYFVQLPQPPPFFRFTFLKVFRFSLGQVLSHLLQPYRCLVQRIVPAPQPFGC